MTYFRPSFAAAMMAIAAVSAPMIPSAQARESAARIAERGHETLQRLESTEPRTRLFARHARAVLVFPGIFKAGLLFGGESGDGVLFVDGKVAGYYNLSGGTFGFQAGAENFSYVLYLMNDSALRYLHRSSGWAVGTGPSVAIINAGAAAESNTTTSNHDVYAFPFNEKGLMADLTLQGTKIAAIHPK
jgi:lipid-binding SYLF domain-containing protein